MRSLSVFLMFLSFPLFAGELFTDPKTGLQILSAEIELPAEGFWYLPDSSLYTPEVGYAYIEAPEAHYEKSFGKRNQALRERRLLDARRRLMWSVRGAIGYPKENEIRVSTDDLNALDLEHRQEVAQALRDGVIAIIQGVELNRKHAGTDPQILAWN